MHRHHVVDLIIIRTLFESRLIVVDTMKLKVIISTYVRSYCIQAPHAIIGCPHTKGYNTIDLLPLICMLRDDPSNMEICIRCINTMGPFCVCMYVCEF